MERELADGEEDWKLPRTAAGELKVPALGRLVKTGWLDVARNVFVGADERPLEERLVCA